MKHAENLPDGSPSSDTIPDMTSGHHHPPTKRLTPLAILGLVLLVVAATSFLVFHSPSVEEIAPGPSTTVLR